MERRHREGKKPAHCDIANKWQNCGLQQSLSLSLLTLTMLFPLLRMPFASSIAEKLLAGARVINA